MTTIARRTRLRRLALSGVALSLVGTTACTADSSDPAAAPATPSATATPASSPASAAASPSPTPTPAPTDTPAPAPHPVSIQALMQKKYDGRGLRVGDVLDENDDYTRYAVTYKSGRLTISGIMNVPSGKGPFPVLILAHGYIDPDVYTTGRGLMREQDYLARQGYVVLHTDYRNHAGSDDDPRDEVRLRLGYTEDVIDAVLAVKKSRLPYLDGERVGLLGRSMGGGVVYNVLVSQPGLVKAAVAYAPVSSDAGDNFNRWTRDDPGRNELSDDILDAYGAPEENRAFWRNVSPVTFFDRITEPLLIQHGTADEECPIRWSREAMQVLTREGKDAQLLTYDGQPHAFDSAWTLSMERTTAFFDQHMAA